MCESGDHSWMAEETYKSHAYTESESTEELDGFDGSTLRRSIPRKPAFSAGG